MVPYGLTLISGPGQSQLAAVHKYFITAVRDVYFCIIYTIDSRRSMLNSSKAHS